MIRTGIIGCGTIADAHAATMALIPGCEIVGVCDKEELMAKQLAERFNIKFYFDDIKKMLEAARPNVVHITTPPQSHFELGRVCLDAGCHVYIEKPFTINSGEAEQLIRLATEKGLKLTVGTDGQYTHAAMRMRRLIKSGYLGGPPVHMEVCYGYDLGEETYAKSILGDKTHWVRRLPGQLLHNNISHGIAKIAEFLTGDDPEVYAYGFTSSFLEGINELDIIDELRVIIKDSSKATAFFTFSTQMRPILREFRIYGPKNGLIADQNQESLVKVPGKKYVSYLERFVPLHNLAKQYRGNMRINAGLFLRRDFQMKSGLRYLTKSFYDCITENTPLPIPYREILLTTRIMDSIFAQLSGQIRQSNQTP